MIPSTHLIVLKTNADWFTRLVRIDDDQAAIYGIERDATRLQIYAIAQPNDSTRDSSRSSIIAERIIIIRGSCLSVSCFPADRSEMEHISDEETALQE
jgi:hypothetical protein